MPRSRSEKQEECSSKPPATPMSAPQVAVTQVRQRTSVSSGRWSRFVRRLSDARCGGRPVFNFGVSSNRPAKVTGDAFSAGFPSSPGVPDRRQLDQEILVTRYRHSRARGSVRKVPECLHRPRYRCVDRLGRGRRGEHPGSPRRTQGPARIQPRRTRRAGPWPGIAAPFGRELGGPDLRRLLGRGRVKGLSVLTTPSRCWSPA